MNQSSGDYWQKVANWQATFTAVSDDRLMFGTDWLFISLARNNGDYLPGLDRHLAAVGLDHPVRRKIFHGNAVRFLGLEDGRPGRERLNKFYNDHGLDVSRLDTVLDA